MLDDHRKLFKGVIPSNWKQANVIHATFKDHDSNRFCDYKKESKFKSELKIIKKKCSSVMNMKEHFSCHYFYLLEQLPLGSVLGYENARLESIDINSFDNRIIFHIKFDVENPFIAKIAELKAIDKTFEGLTNEQFKAREKDWKRNNNELRKYDLTLYDFTYAYSYDLPNGKLSEIIELLDKPEYIAFAKNFISLSNKLHEMQYSLTTMSFEELKIYWDLYDEHNDIFYGVKPDEKTLQQRKERRLQTKEQYDEKNRKVKIIMDEFIKKQKINNDNVEKNKKPKKKKAK